MLAILDVCVSFGYTVSIKRRFLNLTPFTSFYTFCNNHTSFYILNINLNNCDLFYDAMHAGNWTLQQSVVYLSLLLRRNHTFFHLIGHLNHIDIERCQIAEISIVRP